MGKPIGKAKRDIKAGETIEITFNPLTGFESVPIGMTARITIGTPNQTLKG
jgi:hypothetical protein